MSARRASKRCLSRAKPTSIHEERPTNVAAGRWRLIARHASRGVPLCVAGADANEVAPGVATDAADSVIDPEQSARSVQVGNRAVDLAPSVELDERRSLLLADEPMAGASARAVVSSPSGAGGSPVSGAPVSCEGACTVNCGTGAQLSGAGVRIGRCLDQRLWRATSAAKRGRSVIWSWGHYAAGWPSQRHSALKSDREGNSVVSLTRGDADLRRLCAGGVPVAAWLRDDGWYDR